MEQPAPDPLKPRRRGRPPGRSPEQLAQRERNRAHIITAASRVFAEKTYAQATIDDITAAAAISRATFYQYFDSKLALAIDIYDSIAPDWLGHFNRLPLLSDLSCADVKEWTARLAQLFVDHGYVTPLVEQLTLFEPTFRQRLARDLDGVIAGLAAAGLKGCQIEGRTGRDAAVQRARLRLLMLRLDQVCSMIARGELTSAEEVDVYLEIMAEELRERLL